MGQIKNIKLHIVTDIKNYKHNNNNSSNNNNNMTLASVQRARHRLKMFPKLVTSCSSEASVYGKCISLKADDIAPNVCGEEFKMFMQCARKAAQKMNTRI